MNKHFAPVHVSEKDRIKYKEDELDRERIRKMSRINVSVAIKGNRILLRKYDGPTGIGYEQIETCIGGWIELDTHVLLNSDLLRAIAQALDQNGMR